MKKLKPVLILFAGIVGITGCLNKDHFNLDNLDDASWNPQVAVPILKSTVGVNQLFGSTDSNAVNIDGKKVSLVYRGNQVSFNMDNVVEFEDAGISDQTIGYGPTPQSVPIPINLTLDENITSIRLSAGTINIGTSQNTTSASLTFTLSDFKESNGTPLSIVVSAGSSEIKSLVGYSFFPPSNKRLNVSVSGSNAGTCKAGITISGMDYESVTGDFSKSVFRVGQQSFQMHLFKSVATKGNIIFNDPIIAVNGENSFGFSLLPILDSVYATVPKTRDRVQLAKKSGSTFDAIEASRSKGQIQSSRVEINKQNSNIQDFVSISPKIFDYNIGLTAGSVPAAPHTAFKGSKCDLDVSIELPLEGRIVKFEVLDTIELQITQDLSLVREMIIKTYTKNGFPLDTKVSITLMDANKQLILKDAGGALELLSDNLTEAAPVNGEGIVTEPKEYTKEHQILDAELLAKLPLAKYGQLKASMSTTNSGNDLVKVQSDYELEVRVGIKLTANVNLIKNKK